jgi:hypothetical protein
VKTPQYAHAEHAKHLYHVTPDEVDVLVGELEAMGVPELDICSFRQYSGRNVHALTLTDPESDNGGKQRLFISRPHAHEPAGTAACTELAKALAGYEDYADQNGGWRQWVLENFVVTLVPDANPGGSQRAPVKFWDGSEIPNEQFFLWMFGESGDTPGERFPRVDTWDSREVTPPSLLGIAYEQIDEYTYVEPNRDHRSTFFKSFFELDTLHHYGLWLDLHQTEYVNSDRNCHVGLPTMYDALPQVLQEQHLELGDAVHARWAREGGTPYDHPLASYQNNQVQRDFLARVWAPISGRMVHLVTEVQNNNIRTPVATQVRLQLAAVLETMAWMAL